jgi:isopentenyldiphosphate isomerase
MSFASDEHCSISNNALQTLDKLSSHSVLHLRHEALAIWLFDIDGYHLLQ